jgi:SWI/SNF related-matrix-associated actin-dependent regulator of chromatin subfamily C
MTTAPPSTDTYTCDTCGVDCTPVRYHYLKERNYEVCPSCYLDGRFTSTMFSGDFVRLTSNDSGFKQANGFVEEWSDAEILLLLEGIEMFDDDWNAISEHVGTRTREQCVAQFIQLPIEDEYLTSSSQGEMGALQYRRLPFDKGDNPVMSVVAFLASAVGPGVAAAAAKASVEELRADLKGKLKRKEGEAQKAAEKKEGHTEGGEGEKDGDKKDVPMDESTTAAAAGSKPSTPAPDAMDVDAKATKPEDAKSPVPVTVTRAATIALSAAAAKADMLSSVETGRIRDLTSRLVRAQIEKLELKMKTFEAMEEIVEEERKALEAAKIALWKERAEWKKEKDRFAGIVSMPGVVVENGMGSASRAVEVTGMPTVEGEMGEGEGPVVGFGAEVGGADVARLV